MTTIIDAPDEIIAPDVEDDGAPEESMTASEKKKRERDFTKFRPAHEELAHYVNMHSGLDPITPNQVKALLALRIDFNNQDQQVSARAERKAMREAEKSKFDGMTPAQIKAQRAIDRAEKQTAKLEARVIEARAKAMSLRDASAASGEDLAMAVEQAQATPEMEPEDTGKRRIGRRR
jgi:hypothetical protein